MSTPLLELRRLRKGFANRKVLDIDELTLEAGESYVVTGDNGAGKSTLLRIVGGLDSGEVKEFRFDGQPVELQHYPEWLRRQVIYMHQHPYLFSTSVAHNIEYGLKARGLGQQERANLVQDAMVWAGVTHLADVPPQKLSGGEKQRVALARVKVLNPKMYLFDEPTASLDAEARRQTIELIRRLCLDNNCVVIACHDHEIINLPHMHKLVLADGKLTGTAAKLALDGNAL